jgi:amino acid adenylation domain-containing protein
MSDEVYVFPLSSAQQRLWFLDRIAPGNPFYNIPLAIPIRANLNVRALEQALDAIVARHESLRTTFRVINGEPCQLVNPSLDFKLPVTDLRSLPPTERETRTIELATEEARKSFDLERGPLLRGSLITRGWADHVLLLSMHHIVSDGWSMGILAEELTTLYQSFSVGLPANLPELPIQYADFAVWQREWLQGEVLEQQLDYWRKQLAGLPSLEIPTDRPRPSILTYRGSFQPVELSTTLSTDVRRFAQTHSATPFMVLFAAFAVLLHRYSGQDDIVIGIPVANRNRAELEGLIGFFVNSLVLRVDLSGHPTFAELVSRVREMALGAYAHQDLPFEKLVEELQPPRDPSRNPLFQVTFQLVNTPTLRNATADSSRSQLQVQRGSAIFDIAFTLLDTENLFSGVLEYSTDLFDDATVARLERHFRQLLESALANPDLSIPLLNSMSGDERAQLVALSQGPALAPPDQPFVHRMIAEQARRTPQAVAVQSKDAEIDYSELIKRSSRLAAYLRSSGVAVEQRVGILMDRSVEMVTALLGVLEAGGVYVPLDPTYPADRLRYMVADSQARVILTQSRHGELARSIVDANAELVFLDTDAEKIFSGDELLASPTLDPENLAYVLYTSGSTGRPKGVAIPHRALANHMAWMLKQFPLDENDRVLQRTPYSFDASVWEIFAPLMASSRMVVLPVEAQKDPQLIVRHMAEARVTVAQFVPSLIRIVLDEPEFYSCSSLRRIFCGGEALSEDLREKVRTSVGAELINLYGPTEATIDSTFYSASDKPELFGVPIGHPISNTQAYVLDGNLAQVAIGVAGELYIGGSALARGYIEQPAQTAERFLPDPYSSAPGSRLYRTGDRVRRLADGALLFMGRVDDLVKLRGYRIEPGEVEAAIRSIDGVQSCAVVVDENRSATSGLIGYVVANQDEGFAGVETLGEVEKDHVSRWREFYEETYGALPTDHNGDSNFVGWISSYTGLPMDAEAMAEWRETTVERILRLKPRRVLEIGCGTGLLLSLLVPQCERYVATDFSQPVLRYLEARLRSLPGGGSQVELMHCAADDLSAIPDASFDTIILNSVVQYFPNIDYLVRVLAGASRVLAPGGSIFVGDVRSLPLLETFQLSVGLHKLGSDASPKELLNRLRAASSQEEELVIDPEFFNVIAGNLEAISGAEILLKRGRHSNELTRFRYDVVLRTGTATAPYERLSWTTDQLSLDQLVSTILARQPERLIIEHVPNARVVTEVSLLEKLAQASDKEPFSELQRKAHDEARGALHPEDFWQAPALQPWDIRISFSKSPRAESFDVFLTKRGLPAVDDSAPKQRGEQPPSWSKYASNPLRTVIARQMATRIREHLSKQLPEYMVPSTFVLLDELPLLPNGKLNRSALPAANGMRHDERGYMAPRTGVEQALAMIWAEVLAMDRVGVRDDFFTDLGGHSLLATQLISRIREALSSDVPLKQVFLAPTVEQFATVLLDRVPAEREVIETAAGLFVRLSQMSEAELDAALCERESLGA